jgi:hypothetical protein
MSEPAKITRVGVISAKNAARAVTAHMVRKRNLIAAVANPIKIRSEIRSAP